MEIVWFEAGWWIRFVKEVSWLNFRMLRGEGVRGTDSPIREGVSE